MKSKCVRRPFVRPSSRRQSARVGDAIIAVPKMRRFFLLFILLIFDKKPHIFLFFFAILFIILNI